MAQRNVLKYIILGLLEQTPMTGYELTKAFDSDIGEFWSAQHSQIYPQLGKLETAGLIDHEEEVTGEKLARKRYGLTPDGEKQLEGWLNAETTPTVGGRDEFAIKLYFIRDRCDPRLKAMLDSQYAYHTSKLAHLKQQMARKFDNKPNDDDFGHYLVLDHAIRREGAYCQWLGAAMADLSNH